MEPCQQEGRRPLPTLQIPVQQCEPDRGRPGGFACKGWFLGPPSNCLGTPSQLCPCALRPVELGSLGGHWRQTVNTLCWPHGFEGPDALCALSACPCERPGCSSTPLGLATPCFAEGRARRAAQAADAEEWSCADDACMPSCVEDLRVASEALSLEAVAAPGSLVQALDQVLVSPCASPCRSSAAEEVRAAFAEGAHRRRLTEEERRQRRRTLRRERAAHRATIAGLIEELIQGMALVRCGALYVCEPPHAASHPPAPVVCRPRATATVYAWQCRWRQCRGRQEGICEGTGGHRRARAQHRPSLRNGRCPISVPPKLYSIRLARQLGAP